MTLYVPVTFDPEKRSATHLAKDSDEAGANVLRTAGQCWHGRLSRAARIR